MKAGTVSVKTAKTVKAVKDKVMDEFGKTRRQAEKELAKVRKDVEATLKQVSAFVKKNPEKAAAVAAGIGAALGGAVALFLGRKKNK